MTKEAMIQDLIVKYRNKQDLEHAKYRKKLRGMVNAKLKKLYSLEILGKELKDGKGNTGADTKPKVDRKVNRKLGKRRKTNLL
jgi:hypothetical protein